MLPSKDQEDYDFLFKINEHKSNQKCSIVIGQKIKGEICADDIVSFFGNQRIDNLQVIGIIGDNSHVGDKMELHISPSLQCRIRQGDYIGIIHKDRASIVTSTAGPLYEKGKQKVIDKAKDKELYEGIRNPSVLAEPPDNLTIDDFDFLLRIDQPFRVTGRPGLAVIGTVDYGSIAVNDTITLISDKPYSGYTCIGIFRPSTQELKSAHKGDKVVLFISNLTESQAKQGNWLCKFKERNYSINTNVRTGKVIKMRKEGGVYCIPCFINGIAMDAIFDTGASSISMSLTEARFLRKQGKLDDEDIIGIKQYSTAEGTILEGMDVVLKEVVFGGRILRNVRAGIVENEVAPILFGQSALSKFGKITIDYSNETLILE